MHSLDPGFQSSGTGCRRIFLCVQYGPERHKGIRIHSNSRALHKPAYEGLRTAIRHTGPFNEFSDAVGLMQRTQPNYSANDLAQISVPVAIVQSEHDEFIKREHAEYLARNIPNAEFIDLPGVSHFAPLQRPEQFNSAMLEFLGKVLP